MFLNSPQARQYAEGFARRLEGSPAAAVERGYWLAVGRGPEERERQLALAFLAQQADAYRREGRADAGYLARVDLCQALMSMNEFIYVD